MRAVSQRSRLPGDNAARPAIFALGHSPGHAGAAPSLKIFSSDTEAPFTIRVNGRYLYYSALLRKYTGGVVKIVGRGRTPRRDRHAHFAALILTSGLSLQFPLPRSPKAQRFGEIDDSFH